GQTDLLHIVGGTDNNNVASRYVGGTLHLFRRNGVPWNLLIKVKDGNGAVETIAYKPMVSDAYTKGTVGCTYPSYCAASGLWLATSVTRNDGKYDHTLTYKYMDGRFDLRGQGWLGFAQVNATDVQSSSVRELYFPLSKPSLINAASHPFVGLVERERTTTPIGNGMKRITDRLHTWIETAVPFSTATTTFVWIGQTTELE